MITRRNTLALMRSGLAFGAIGTAAAMTQCQLVDAPAATPDPLLALIQTYREQIANYNAAPTHIGTDEDDVLAATTWHPPYDRLCEDPPAATTIEGVKEAMRLVIHEEENCGGQEALTCNVLRAALAYFDGRAA